MRSGPSRRAAVLMNEAAQAIPSDDPSGSQHPALERLPRYPLVKALVRPRPLVVIDVFAKQVVQMPASVPNTSRSCRRSQGV